MNDRERCLYIALVGGQPAPILLGLIHLAGTTDLPRPTDILLVGTSAVRAQMERLRRVLPAVVTQALADASPVRISEQIVDDPYAVDKTHALIADALAAFDEASIVLNLTGGTAMMTLGAYLAGRDRAAIRPNMPLLAQYVVTGDHTFRYCDMQTQRWTKRPFPHPLRGLSLFAFCTAHGVEIVPTPDAHPEWNSLARAMADGGPLMDAASAIKALNFEYRREPFRDETGKTQRNGLSFKKQEEMYMPADENVRRFCDRLTEAGLLLQRRRGSYLVPRNANGDIGDFWRGQWLERAVYGSLQPFQKQGWLASAADDGLLLNARIKPEGDEIDVLAMFLGQTIVVECKDWALLHEYRAAEFKRAIDHLGELRRRLGGTYARAYLVVTRLNVAGPRAQIIRREIEMRCRNLNVALVELATLPADLRKRVAQDPALGRKVSSTNPLLTRWFATELLQLSERADMP